VVWWGRRRLLFSYSVLVPAALKFFVSYADGAVESLWSIDQYFEFVLVLMLSTGLSFQVRSWFAVGSKIAAETNITQRPWWGGP
jgi:Sec-independent protein secretion pathway component TatC